LVIEEIDFLASGSKGANKEMFYTLLSELDSIDEKYSNVLIIATTNKLEDLDKSLRRGGRLDIDIRFDMPNSEERYEILKAHLSLLQAEVSINNEDLVIIARAASGFVSSDLAQIVRNAHLKAIKEKSDQESTVNLTRQHLEGSIIEAKPLSISDLLVEVPKVRWDEIGGNEDIKFQVRQCVEWPLRYP
jgi:AAA family ATPase